MGHEGRVYNSGLDQLSSTYDCKHNKTTTKTIITDLSTFPPVEVKRSKHAINEFPTHDWEAIELGYSLLLDGTHYNKLFKVIQGNILLCQNIDIIFLHDDSLTDNTFVGKPKLLHWIIPKFGYN